MEPWLLMQTPHSATMTHATEAACLLFHHEAAVVAGVRWGWGASRVLLTGLMPPPSDVAAQCDQAGFLFWMKALIPSCPSCRATLSTMVWEARR